MQSNRTVLPADYNILLAAMMLIKKGTLVALLLSLLLNKFAPGPPGGPLLSDGKPFCIQYF
jgi:hypothetical protein